VRIVKLALLIVTFMVIVSPAFAQEEIAILINGETVNVGDQPPVQLNGRTLVPVRLVSEILGASVDWDDKSQTVLIASSGQDNSNVDLSPMASQSGIKIVVNGRQVQTDQPPVVMNGRTMVPVRFVSEALGAEVLWIDETRTVSIIKDFDAKHSFRDALLLVRSLKGMQFKVISYEHDQWPYFILVPDGWNELWEQDYKVRRLFKDSYPSDFSISLTSQEFKEPRIRPASVYSYLPYTFFLSRDYLDITERFPIVMGGLPGYYVSQNSFIDFKYPRFKETYKVQTGLGSFELTFNSRPDDFDDYRSLVETIVRTAQLPMAGEGAGERAELAKEYLNYMVKVNERSQYLPGFAQKSSLNWGIEPMDSLEKWNDFNVWLKNQYVGFDEVHALLRDYTNKVIEYLEVTSSRNHDAIILSGQKVDAALEAYNNEVKRVSEAIFSAYYEGDEIKIGPTEKYSWSAGITQITNKKIDIDLFIPQKWNTVRNGNDLKVTDATGSYSFRFYLDDSIKDKVVGDSEEISLVTYTELCKSKLQGKEIIFSDYGLFEGSNGRRIVYQDTINNKEVIVNLFFGPAHDGKFFVIETVMPSEFEPEEVEMLSIMLDSWDVDYTSQ